MALGSCSPLPRGQVYPCEGRGRNDMNNDDIRFKGINNFHTSGREKEDLPISKIYLLAD
jgi:hypothetical protein